MPTTHFFVILFSMKQYLDDAIIHLKHETYLSVILFLAPFLYFLSGINIDMYSPSMPTIATYFHATIAATKNTISASLLGWAIGALIFGILIDGLGRKKVLVFGLFFYVVSSYSAIFCNNIHQLTWIRFIQGFAMASVLGARVLIVDLFKDKRYTIGMLYTSIGYGIGPIIGPFIGGLLQYYFSWQANFYVLTFIAAIILLALLLFLKETIPQRHSLRFFHVMERYISVVSHKKFMAGVVLGGLMQIQLILYPTVGPFIVERVLHQTVLAYGNSALIVGGSYLTGNLCNRLFLRYFLPKQICSIGFSILVFGLIISFLFAALHIFDITTLILPIFITCMGAGLIFPMVLSANLKEFAHTAGIAMAVQSSTLLLIGAIGMFLINQVHIAGLFELSYILLGLVILEVTIFFGYYRKIFSTAGEVVI